MNTAQAKELSLPGFLQTLGYQPARVRGHDLWYTSPFRPDERTPSFKIDEAKNLWFDHGMGEGGTIIDFVQHLYRTHDVARVLAIISDATGGVIAHAEVPRQERLQIERPSPVIESVGAITDRALEGYLRTRAIPLDLARLYLQEVRYRVEERTFRALGFQNNAGGFEVRNAAFKGSLGTKDITYLAQPGRMDAAVFEGGLDFVSALAHYKRERPASNVLVLNSVAMVDRAVRALRENQITQLSAFLDHDKAGEAALEALRTQGPWDTRDASGFYLGFKDVNEFLQAADERSISKSYLKER